MGIGGVARACIMHRASAGLKWEPRFENALNAVEDRMQNRLASVAVCAGLAVAGLVGGIERAQAQPAPAPALTPPADTAALRAQYEKWRTEFKTWGRWAPVGQESKGA